MWTSVVVWWMMMDDCSLRSPIYYQFNRHSCEGGLPTRWTSLKKHCGEFHRPQTEGVMWHGGKQIAAPSVSGLSKLPWREAWQWQCVVVSWVASILLFHICQLSRVWSGIDCERSNRRGRRWVMEMEWAIEVEEDLNTWAGKERKENRRGGKSGVCFGYKWGLGWVVPVPQLWQERTVSPWQQWHDKGSSLQITPDYSQYWYVHVCTWGWRVCTRAACLLCATATIFQRALSIQCTCC